MKRLAFTVTVEELPVSTKDYRVAGSVCHAVTLELRRIYGEQVNVLVNLDEWLSANEINGLGKDAA